MLTGAYGAGATTGTPLAGGLPGGANAMRRDISANCATALDAADDSGPDQSLKLAQTFSRHDVGGMFQPLESCRALQILQLQSMLRPANAGLTADQQQQ